MRRIIAFSCLPAAASLVFCLFPANLASVGESGPRMPTADEWFAIESPLAAVGLRGSDVLDFAKGKRCSFWFVRADRLRAFTGLTPPKLQELRRNHPEWLEQRTISFVDGCKSIYQGSILVISHCWEAPEEPDKMGAQFAAVKQHLSAHPEVELVWFDFWCMPQGREKPHAEDAELEVMLPNINLLYLFCDVLILLDVSYMSRFWASARTRARASREGLAC